MRFTPLKNGITRGQGNKLKIQPNIKFNKVNLAQASKLSASVKWVGCLTTYKHG
jgi:hypothetical protein